jgi:hypothetical protein
LRSAITIRDHIVSRARAFRFPALIAWLAVCFYEGERSHPSRRVFATWIGVLIFYSCAVYLIRCPKCGARLGAAASKAHEFGKYGRLPTVHNCPHCGVPFDTPMPENPN